MKNTKKTLILVLCAVAVMVASVWGTLAYLTDRSSVENTFTVGNVAITAEKGKLNFFVCYMSSGHVCIRGRVLAGEDFGYGNVQILSNQDGTVIGNFGHFLGIQISIGKTAGFLKGGNRNFALMANISDILNTVEHKDPPFKIIEENLKHLLTN